MGLSLSSPLPGRAPPVASQPASPRPLVVVLEDDPALAATAEELCSGLGCSTGAYTAPGQFLSDFESGAPDAVILDWRLEREVGSAVFLAIRHRFPTVPVVCWTGMAIDRLPAMVRDDPLTRVVGKGSGVAQFEEAVRWAAGSIAGAPGGSPAGGQDVGYLPDTA